MKVFHTLAALPLLVLGFANLAAASTIAQALDKLYAFILYDMNVDVWGLGAGYVATACKGSQPDGRCSFDEFINYVQTGTASSSPSYHTFPSNYGISSDIAIQVVESLVEKVPTWNARYGLIVGGTTSDSGLRTSLNDLLQRTVSSARSRGLAYDRRLKDANFIMTLLATEMRAKVNKDIIDFLTAEVRDVTWRTYVPPQSTLDRRSWSEISWVRMVELYPTLADPQSALSKKVRDAIDKFYEDDDNVANGQIMRISVSVPRGCGK